MEIRIKTIEELGATYIGLEVLTETPDQAAEATRRLLGTEQQPGRPDLETQVEDRNRRIDYLEDQLAASREARETLAKAVTAEAERADAASKRAVEATAKLIALRKATHAGTGSAARLLTVMAILDQKEPLA
jgi:predicted  nucleic acid-binding Zn-ribbon protein